MLHKRCAIVQLRQRLYCLYNIGISINDIINAPTAEIYKTLTLSDLFCSKRPLQLSSSTWNPQVLGDSLEFKVEQSFLQMKPKSPITSRLSTSKYGGLLPWLFRLLIDFYRVALIFGTMNYA